MTMPFVYRRLDRLFYQVKQRIPLNDTLLLTPSIVFGVVPQSSLPNRPHQIMRGDFEVCPAKPGDFVISMSSFQHGFEYCSNDGGISPDYTLLRPKFDKQVGRFFKYSLKSQFLIQQLSLFRSGIRQGQRLQWNRIRYVRIPVPDLETAKVVADFLDRETGRIDDLIGKKQRLLKLADEKRAALITAAITGWINAETVRGSISEVYKGMGFWPRGCWEELMPLKHVCIINPETLPESTDPDFEFHYIDIGNVTLHDGVIAHDTIRFSQSPSRARKPVREGDVIVSTVRTYLKAVALIGSNANNRVVSTGFAVLRPKPEVSPRYLHRVVQSDPFVEGVVVASTGISYPAINPSTLGNILVTCPDRKTQDTIADFLDRETGRIDALKAKTLASIDRLREYRAALITAAVTGQIDVTVGSGSGAAERQLEAIQQAEQA